MDPSLETALAALRQLRHDRQNGLITDRDYDRRIATLLQGQNAPVLLALLQAEGGAPAVPSPPAAPVAPAPAVGPGRVAPPTAPTPDFPETRKPAVPPAATMPDFTGLKRPTPPAVPPVPPVAAPPPTAVEDEAAAELGAPPAGSPTLNYVLIGGGVLLLVLLVVYLMSGPRASEHLTSTSRTAADSAATAPEVGPQAPQLERPPVAAPETVRVFPQTAPVVPAPDSTAPASAAVPSAPVAAPAAAPAADSTATVALPVATAAAAEQAVRGALASYYADLQAAPFDAGAHFAPAVERFLLLRGTTPAAISENLATNHFPEFQDYRASIAPGSLRVSAPAADGSRTATYTEVARSFRLTLQQHQQTRTQVRVRFTPDYKIDYLRQEKVIENTLMP
ncbi:hypothetical protein [Hymenobacter nivis]|uniref:SHOCT domain-containing protein n=1 Tax=Hymenobacter nivis TaxID=1850093 RepID=A0A2Z3GMY0_9BACT|nr:hypothetical protein [Hymenobacter nivis]AWM33492.1 hypothetical protein DDQ68_12260 [Hymenobacter nivis]